MRLPSLDHLSDRAFAAFQRFPATLISAILGAASMIVDLEGQKGGHYDPEISAFVRFGLTCLLALPTYLAIELWLERRGERLLNHHDTPRRRTGMRFLLYLAAAFLLGLFYYSYSAVETDAIQLFLFLLAAHLGVSFVAYLKKNETNGFWQFNKMVLLRILTALLYSFVLELGLSLALMAIDRLFGVEIATETYIQLACVLAVFNTWFFLAGVPYSLAGQEERRDYPKGLKLFTQSVLLPLVVIYLAILYPYAVKLLLAWELPRGWVSNPVLWNAVVGILSFLLLYPLRTQNGSHPTQSSVLSPHHSPNPDGPPSTQHSARIAHDPLSTQNSPNPAHHSPFSRFTRYYFVALLPLLSLPALGISTRVRDHGITEPRYFVIALVLWLLGISLYFIISKRKDIRVIPMTLCAVALLSSVGPTSAFRLSEADQLSRLERLLEQHELIGNDQIGSKRDIRVKRLVPMEDFESIRSIASYLQRDHEHEVLENWLRDRAPRMTDHPGVVVKKLTYETDIASVLNFASSGGDVTSSFIRFGGNGRAAQQISGYDYYVPIQLGPMGDHRRGNESDTLLKAGALVVYHRQGDQLTVSNGADADGRPSAQTLTYASIVSELRSRRDSVIRAGGDPDSMNTNIYRSSAPMDGHRIELLFTMREGSIESGPSVSGESRRPGAAPYADSTAQIWGNGALFIKLK